MFGPEYAATSPMPWYLEAPLLFRRRPKDAVRRRCCWCVEEAESAAFSARGCGVDCVGGVVVDATLARVVSCGDDGVAVKDGVVLLLAA